VDRGLYRLVADGEGWGRLLKALEKAERVAVDLETDGLSASSCGIVGISLSTGEN
jgi:hypothetical protein